MAIGAVAIVSLWCPRLPPARAASGPEHGTVIAIGGGTLVPEIGRRFVAEAGGPQANFVLIPTAEVDQNISDRLRRSYMHLFGIERLVMLHTRDRRTADSEGFVAPLRDANGVFFGGGRQWRVTDVFLNTRAADALRALLARGGVIAGTSAGASLLASFMVRGAPESNSNMMAPGHEQGFGFIQGVAIDQHITARGRRGDLAAVVAKHPELLGIGIDQCTAIVAQRNAFEVIGRGHVYITNAAVYDPAQRVLAPGDRFDLSTRTRIDTPSRPPSGESDSCVTSNQ